MSKKNLYGLTGKLTAKPGMADKLASILLQASETVATTEGCRAYIVSRPTDNSDVVSVFELWDTKEQHDNSLKLPEVRALIAQGMPLIEGTPEGIALEILGGHGL